MNAVIKKFKIEFLNFSLQIASDEATIANIQKLIEPIFKVKEIQSFENDVWILDFSIRQERNFLEIDGVRFVLASDTDEYYVNKVDSNITELIVPSNVQNGLFSVRYNKKIKNVHVVLSDPLLISRWLVRIVKNFFSSNILSSGGYFIHASSVIKDDSCYLFHGSSGAGKTSIAFLSAFRGKSEFISDDTVCIYQGEVYSWPKRIALGKAVLKKIEICSSRFENLRRTKEKLPYSYSSHDFVNEWGWTKKDRISFDWDEFLDIFEIKCRDKGKPKFIIFLTISTEIKEIMVEKMSKEDGQILLNKSILQGSELRFMEDYLNCWGNLQKKDSQLINFEQVNYYKVTNGPNASGNIESILNKIDV